MKDDDDELIITYAADMPMRWMPALDRMCRIANINSKVTIFEVTKRQNYELITGTGGDRPIYTGSREWQEQAITNRNVHKGPIPGMCITHSPR